MTFLNGELDEEIYVEQFESFVVLVKNTRCVNLLIPFMDLKKEFI